jgi:glycosyltransferase involved in cell wall biosynthesis
MTITPKISILLATRGRTEMLKKSLASLVDLASDPSSLEILLAFDNDDEKTFNWVQENVLTSLDDKNVDYTCMSFDRLGYIRLNEYYNTLALAAQGDWLFFWGDDAIMETQDWDKEIIAHTGKFHVLRALTHKCHPLAIFPIVPRKWVELFGYFSAHQLNDNWVSQIAYMADVMETIQVEIEHDRFDLTGNNNDENYQNRPMLEGNPRDPRDFHHANWTLRRLEDAEKITKYRESLGEDTSFYKNFRAGKQDPWEKLKDNDINKQMVQFTLPAQRMIG